jgi:hypothetical protein
MTKRPIAMEALGALAFWGAFFAVWGALALIFALSSSVALAQNAASAKGAKAPPGAKPAATRP